MKEVFLVGRIVAGGYFIYSGVNHFAHLAMMSELAAHRGVPFATAAVVAAGILLLVGGVSLLFGLVPKLGIAALVLFFVPVTFMMHAFWHEQGQARMMDLINFTKNFALLGAVLMTAAVPEPWPLSVDPRLHVARHLRG
jgi:putative oxidoreductase